MNANKLIELEAIAAYRAGAERRRARRLLKHGKQTTDEDVEPSILSTAGIVTISKPADAKSVLSLGGATKVFGRSSISIPEFRYYLARLKR